MPICDRQEGKDGFFGKEKSWVCAFGEKRFFQLFFPLIVLYAGGNTHWKQLQLKKKEGFFFAFVPQNSVVILRRHKLFLFPSRAKTLFCSEHTYITYVLYAPLLPPKTIVLPKVRCVTLIYYYVCRLRVR